MNPPDDQPFVCALSDQQLRRRRATLAARFRSLVIATEELENGCQFQIPAAAESIMAAAELVAAERECCRFLTFELIVQAAVDLATLRVTGPPGAKEFWMTLFL